MQYMHGRNLHDRLIKEFKILKWEHKIGIVSDIIDGLKQIHKQNIIHRNLHSGNVLQSYHYPHIADLGLSYQSLTSNKNNTYGVLPYIAPEILNGEPYTTASDIYSFGILMSLVSTGQQPFYNIAHDENKRCCEDKIIALKKLYNSQNISNEFLNEVNKIVIIFFFILRESLLLLNKNILSYY